MDAAYNRKTSISFINYAIMIMFLLWNIWGCIMFLADILVSDAAYSNLYGEDMLSLRGAVPVWTMLAYGLAVGSGLLAAILLLRRKKLAAPIFIFSLITAIISFIWMFTSGATQILRVSGFWVMPLIVILIGLSEIWYTRRQIGRHIVR